MGWWTIEAPRMATWFVMVIVVYWICKKFGVKDEKKVKK